MNANSETFARLIEAAMQLCREGSVIAESTTDDFREVMRMLTAKEARLELRIGFTPQPHVTAEIIRDCDGELIGHLFKHEAHTAVVN